MNDGAGAMRMRPPGPSGRALTADEEKSAARLASTLYLARLDARAASDEARAFVAERPCASESQLAAALGVNRGTIRAWKGRGRP